MSDFNFTPQPYSSSSISIPISPEKKTTPVRRTNSLPLVYKSNTLKRTRSNPLENRIINREGITFDQGDKIFNTFKDNLLRYAQQANDEGIYTADNIRKGNINFYYFIGRLNPPHEGHLTALYKLVRMARADNACALILLGSGPGRERTMDNPLDFNTKAAFIQRKLTEAGYIYGTDFVIQEMKNPAVDVTTHILSRLGVVNPSTETINITHVAGGKDDDANKLKFALTAAQKAAQKARNTATVSGKVKIIIPVTSKIGKAMSGTQVRKDVYQTIINGLGYAGWPQKYKDFYGEDAEPIYNAIAEVAREAERTNPGSIQTYLGLEPEGGGSKRKSKTKKRSNLKKRRTQRKKRRTTRRQ